MKFRGRNCRSGPSSPRWNTISPTARPACSPCTTTIFPPPFPSMRYLMASLIWLDNCAPFPDPEAALPEGLLAAGADLTVERLTQAYRQGIFPWFNEG